MDFTLEAFGDYGHGMMKEGAFLTWLHFLLRENNLATLVNNTCYTCGKLRWYSPEAIEDCTTFYKLLERCNFKKKCSHATFSYSVAAIDVGL